MPAFSPVEYASYPLLAHWEAIGFQEIAASTPATANGDVFGNITDHGPNAISLLQGTGSLKSLLRPTGGPNSLPAVEMDGADDFFWLAQHLCPAQSTWFIVANIPAVTITDIFTIFCGYENSLQWRMDTGKQRLVAAVLADIGSSSGSVAANTWFQASVGLDFINGLGTFQFGASIDSSIGTWPTTGSPAQYRGCGPWVAMGKNLNGAEFFRGKWATIFGFAGIMGSTERAANHAMISSVAGL